MQGWGRTPEVEFVRQFGRQRAAELRGLFPLSRGTRRPPEEEQSSVAPSSKAGLFTYRMSLPIRNILPLTISRAATGVVASVLPTSQLFDHLICTAEQG